MVSAAAAAGMKRSVGLDHIRIAHRKGKVIQLDLLLDSHQSLLWKWLDSPGLAAVWIAPPCGKASRKPRAHSCCVVSWRALLHVVFSDSTNFVALEFICIVFPWLFYLA